MIKQGIMFDPTPYYLTRKPMAKRPNTAPEQVTVEDMSALVSRLSRPITSTARKATVYSAPRKEYEFEFQNKAVLPNPRFYWTKFPTLDKHYPGTWRTANPDEVEKIVERLTRPTVAHESRAEDCISRRNEIVRARAARLAADNDQKRYAEALRQELSLIKSPPSARMKSMDSTMESTEIMAC